jgi:DNA-binding MarR family transcriptional regulator
MKRGRAVNRVAGRAGSRARKAGKVAKRDLSKADYERLAALRYLLRRFLVFSENAAMEVGLTAQQHQALLAIKGYPGREHVTIGELAERLAIRHPSAVGLIDRLAAKTLIHRQGSSVDRRWVLIRLTPRAEELLAKLSVMHQNELKRLAPLLEMLLGGIEYGASPTPGGR